MDKFNLLFIIGNEGTGHHLFNECKLENYPYERLHSLIKNYFNLYTTPEQQVSIKKKIFNLTKHNLGVVCYERASYPYGRPTNPLISHDILGFQDLFKNMNHVNLYYIVLTRNIIYSTLSSKTRFDVNKSIIYCSRMQEMCLTYINSQIQLLPKDKYIIVDLNNIQSNIKKFIEYIYSKSNIKIECNYSAITNSFDIKYLSHKDYNYLVNYFNDERLEQFKFLKENTILF